MSPIKISDRHNFYREWMERAFRASLVVAGVNRGPDIMRSILIWAIACLVLFVIPWNHVPIIGVKAEDLSHEVRLGLSAVAAVIVVFSISIIYQLIKQPRVMYDEVVRRAVKAECMLSEIDNVERDKETLSSLHKEGVELYHSFVSPDDPLAPIKWTTDMDGWRERVRDSIRDRWSVSTLHEFNDPSRSGGFSYQRRDRGRTQINDAGGRNLTALYSGYIHSLDHIIRFNGGDHFGQRRLLEASLRDELEKVNSAAVSTSPSSGRPL